MAVETGSGCGSLRVGTEQWSSEALVGRSDRGNLILGVGEMDRAPHEVRLDLSDPRGPEAADRAMEFLVEEVRQLRVLRLAHAPGGSAPAGTRAGETVVYSSLLLSLAGTPALRALILLVQDWLARRNSGTIHIKVGDNVLEITAGKPRQTAAAIEAFTNLVATAAQEQDDE
ncbi:hypothetical protein [Kitasatospora griseola]|uniref:hypothetical protein n=1 Tax=Kitasatospora griseola TaxID=2064 RepID=UPI0034208EF8